jgi:hypothetical protein
MSILAAQPFISNSVFIGEFGVAAWHSRVERSRELSKQEERSRAVHDYDEGCWLKEGGYRQQMKTNDTQRREKRTYSG